MANFQGLGDILAGDVDVEWRGGRVFSQKHGSAEAKLPDKDLPKLNVEGTVEPSIEVRREEGLNTPQKLYAIDHKTNRKELLLDLNPKFAELRFATVEPVAWKTRDGMDGHGGLYLPLDYVPGQQYPLVIQTHFFNPETFIIDGPWSSGFAAQVLASKGFVVVQVGELLSHEEFHRLANTPAETPRVMAIYEGLVDALAARGLIDRNRVGVFGFSRTVYYVTYTLTHSMYPFAAAILEDGVDGGYFQYLSFPMLDSEYESIYGGSPFGEALQSWTKNAPAFNLGKVRTPIRIMEHGCLGALEQWEWFSGLSLLHKPVDMDQFITAVRQLGLFWMIVNDEPPQS